MMGPDNVKVQATHILPQTHGQPQVQSGPSSNQQGEESEDGHQQPAASKKLSSRYRGVCWNKKNKRWQAAINSSGKYLYLGSYVMEEDAARAFDKAAIKIRGRKARINFKFDDYLSELKFHNQSQSQHSSIKEELQNGHDSSNGMNTVLTKSPHPRFHDCHFEQNIDAHASRHYGRFPPQVHHADPSNREGALINGVPVHHDDRLVAGRLDLATPMRSEGNMDRLQSEAIWGRVLNNNGECRTSDMSFPLPALGPLGSSGDQMRPHQNQYVNVGSVPLQSRDHVPLSRPEDDQGVQQIPLSQSEDQYKHPVVAGYSNTPAECGKLPQMDSQADPMKTMPSDCQIVKILPNACGVFGMMYARPGCAETGALIWDGQTAHNLGMFSTQEDAHRGCTGASLLVVKMIQQFFPGSKTAALGLSSAPEVTKTADQMKMEASLNKDPMPAASLPPVALPSPYQVYNASEIQNPQPIVSPLDFGSRENFVRLMGSITSEDIGKVLNGTQIPDEDRTSTPLFSAQKKTVSPQPSLSAPLGGDIFSNGRAGSLGGSLLYYDSISSSIVGLISMADARGAPLDPIVVDDKALTGKQKGAWEESDLRSIPSIRGSLTEIGAVLFGGQQNEVNGPPQTSKAPEGEAVETTAIPESAAPKTTKAASQSQANHPREEKNAYNDVVDLIVSRDGGNETPEGVEDLVRTSAVPGFEEKPSDAQDDEENVGGNMIVGAKRKADDEAEDSVAFQKRSKQAEDSSKL